MTRATPDPKDHPGPGRNSRTAAWTGQDVLAAPLTAAANTSVKITSVTIPAEVSGPLMSCPWSPPVMDHLRAAIEPPPGTPCVSTGTKLAKGGGVHVLPTPR